MMGREIPFITLEAALDEVHNQWANPQDFIDHVGLKRAYTGTEMREGLKEAMEIAAGI